MRDRDQEREREGRGLKTTRTTKTAKTTAKVCTEYEFAHVYTNIYFKD